MNIASLTENITIYLKKNLQEKRFAHSLRTANTCKQLAKKYGLDENTAYFAGLSHDICKNLLDTALTELAQKDGNPIRDFEKAKPNLLHGRAGANLLQNDFGIQDKQILDSVRYHTFGAQNIGELALLTFIADKIEPERPQMTEAYCKSIENLTLYELGYKIAQENGEAVIRKNKILTPDTEDFIRWLNDKVCSF
ncbi:MAG: bis(5'-nucleosyl)-tetraphosphatase (symmetrical) YqeK [Treponemataceae bacterium]